MISPRPLSGLSFFALFVALSSTRCAFFQPTTSVEALLAESEAVDSELVLEEESDPKTNPEKEAASASPQQRSLASRRPAFQWPLRQIKLNSPFGVRDGQLHAGVDLKAATGTPVYAAMGGQVIYSGDAIAGYGEVVIVRHGGGYSTLYAHASHLLVSTGQRVQKGQCIAYSGDTGKVSGPHLHFEVREGARPVDPQPILTRRSLAHR